MPSEQLPPMNDDDATTDADKGRQVMNAINTIDANDPSKFLTRSFVMLRNEGHSIRLINRDDARKAISIPWDEIDALRNLLGGTAPVVVANTPAPADSAKLGEAIANAAIRIGIIDGLQPLTGPQLVMLCDDIAQVAERAIDEHQVPLTEVADDCSICGKPLPESITSGIFGVHQNCLVSERGDFRLAQATWDAICTETAKGGDCPSADIIMDAFRLVRAMALLPAASQPDSASSKCVKCEMLLHIPCGLCLGSTVCCVCKLAAARSAEKE